MSIGMKMTVIHAPSTNLATSTTITVIPVTKPPSPFTSALLSQLSPRFLTQCMTIPNCDRVKAKKCANGVERYQAIGNSAKNNQ